MALAHFVNDAELMLNAQSLINGSGDGLVIIGNSEQNAGSIQSARQQVFNESVPGIDIFAGRPEEIRGSVFALAEKFPEQRGELVL